MAASAKWYTNAVLGVFSSTAARRFDWVNDTIKVTLHTSAYAYSQTANTYYSDVTSELATGSGYTAGGYTMVNKTLTYDAASKEVRLDADDPQWTAATFTFRTYVIRKDTGTPHLRCSVTEIWGLTSPFRAERTPWWEMQLGG
jgi:hypothetical protein